MLCTVRGGREGLHTSWAALKKKQILLVTQKVVILQLHASYLAATYPLWIHNLQTQIQIVMLLQEGMDLIKEKKILLHTKE